MEQRNSDPISKALERARAEHPRTEHPGGSVRGWVQPSNGAATPALMFVANREVSLELDDLARNNVLGGPEREDPAVSDKYRLLRTRILQIMRARGWKSLGITSAAPKSGKTLTSINLGMSMAREGNYQVVLADGDIRKPTVASVLGITEGYGMVDYLTGEAEFEDVLVNIGNVPNLTILPGNSRRPETTPDLLKSPRMTQMLQRLGKTAAPTIFLIDLPPILLGDDVLAVAAGLDALLLVIDEGRTTMEELHESMAVLSGINLIGTVLNNSSEKLKPFTGYYQAGN